MSNSCNRLVVVGIGLVLVTACTVDPEERTSLKSSPTAESTWAAADQAPTVVAPGAWAPDLSTPWAAAKEWLARYLSASWQDRLPTDWVGRTRPVVTGELAYEYEQILAREGGGGASWLEFTSGKCVTAVEDTKTTEPSEHRATETYASVLLSAKVVTTCPAVGRSSEPFAAVVDVVREHDGQWRVSTRIS
jgi:hypothetical protein